MQDSVLTIRPARGVFISIEGIDGAGKSSQLASIAAQLGAAGHSVTLTREPGGTDVGEALRELVLQRPMHAMAEAMAVFAARAQHVHEVIAPALAAGRTVLSDRFSDASFAYQGAGRGLAWADLQTLAKLAQTVALDNGQTVFVQPDLTLWFDLPPATAAARRAAARGADRFEREDLEFFTAVAAGYARRAAEQPQRIVRIDAAPAPEQVAAQVHAAIAHFLQTHGVQR